MVTNCTAGLLESGCSFVVFGCTDVIQGKLMKSIRGIRMFITENLSVDGERFFVIPARGRMVTLNARQEFPGY